MKVPGGFGPRTLHFGHLPIKNIKLLIQVSDSLVYSLEIGKDILQRFLFLFL
jgi:hypothetical protein